MQLDLVIKELVTQFLLLLLLLFLLLLLLLQVVKELQTSAREAILLLRAMIGEVCVNVEEEESAICSLFSSLQVM